MQNTEKKWENSCIHCDDVITNPICPHCIEENIKDWLSQKKPSLNKHLKTVSKEYVFGLEKTHCIICGRLMNLCTYCYTAEVFDLLKEKAPELIEEFVLFFNFDLFYEGYKKEAEIYSNNYVKKVIT